MDTDGVTRRGTAWSDTWMINFDSWTMTWTLRYSMTTAERNAAREDCKPKVVPDVEPATNAVQRIAVAMLAVSPRSLVSVVHDNKVAVIGATSTPAKRGLTAAVFRAAFRSAPAKTKQVTFAARKGIS